MQYLSLTTTVLFAAALAAQEGPNPRHAAHDALKSLAGNWDYVMKSEAMPGVPGMEKPTECPGIERAELICGGLWLRSTFDGTWNGAPFQGIWLAGYDPFQQKYMSYWVGSDEKECSMSTMEGTYDTASKTWNWNGETPHGRMRSKVVFDSADSSTETCFMVGPDGKEQKCMEIVRKRAKSAPSVEASAKPMPKLSKELEVLHQDVGDWDATVKMAGEPGQPASAEQATERCARPATAAGCGRTSRAT
jgi:hypothetical protein